MHYANIEMECLYGLLQMPWAFFHTAIWRHFLNKPAQY
jgi:hypothetical protein